MDADIEKEEEGETSTFREFEKALENEMFEFNESKGENIEEKMEIMGRILPVNSNERVLRATKNYNSR